jgi:hypothetical protein
MLNRKPVRRGGLLPLSKFNIQGPPYLRWGIPVKRVDELCINTLRFLTVETVETAQSGHPELGFNVETVVNRALALVR